VTNQNQRIEIQSYVDYYSFIPILESNEDRNMRRPGTPTAQLGELYTEYDDLLDTLDMLNSQFKPQNRFHIMKRNELKRQVQVIFEKLADVHEKIADYAFVIMRGDV